MSEYQYFEFQSLDQPLTTKAKQELRSLSSRAQVTNHSASYVYHYSNFRGDSLELVKRYFDAMLYVTNWGSRQVMFRFPKNAISQATQEQFTYGAHDNLCAMTWKVAGDHVILNFEMNSEDGTDGEWMEGEGMLSTFVGVRQDILRGDLRPLYLMWLAIIQEDDWRLETDGDTDEDYEVNKNDPLNALEPPVPPNLAKGTAAQKSLVDFIGLSNDLRRVAAQASATIDKSNENLENLIDHLTDAEKHDFLARLLRGEVLLDIVLANRLRTFKTPVLNPAANTPPLRRIRDLLMWAAEAKKERKEKAQQAAAAAHAKKLEALAAKAPALWQQVNSLIALKKVNAYDEAVAILLELRELAKHQGQFPQFRDRIDDITEQYPKLSGLKSRLQQAKLL